MSTKSIIGIIDEDSSLANFIKDIVKQVVLKFLKVNIMNTKRYTNVGSILPEIKTKKEIS